MDGRLIFDLRECPPACPCNCHRLFWVLPKPEQRRVCASCPQPKEAREPDPHQLPVPSAQDNFRLLTRELREELEVGNTPPTK